MKELALQIAKKSFALKCDKAGKPYMEHLMRVMDNVNKGKSCILPELDIIAILHDLMEDCPEWNEKSLRCLFTDAIVDSLVALTHKPSQSYFDYITEVLDDEWATIIKKADLEDNMDIARLKEVTKEDLERIQKYHKAYIRIVNAS